MKIVVSPSTIPSFNLAAEEYLFNGEVNHFFFSIATIPA